MDAKSQPSRGIVAPTPGRPYALLVLLHLHWFIRLRWMFAGGALVALGLEQVLTPGVRRPPMLWLVAILVGATNVAWAIVAHLLRRELEDAEHEQKGVIRAGQLFVSVQIASDLFLLTWILTLTGGVENPMSLFYLFHIAMCGLLIRTWQGLIQATWAVALFTTMCVGQQQGWLPYYPFLPLLPSTGLHLVPQHVALVAIVQAAAVFGTLYFTDRIGKVLDGRETMLIGANAALQHSQRAIQDLQRRRSRFMQIAAHQLKSPLAMVQTLANLIREEIVTEPSAIRETCGKIVRRAKEGIAQVSELLALARVQEADPQRHRNARSDVGETVSQLCRRHAPGAEQKGLQFQWECPVGAEVLALVDRTDLADAVGNLIDNAIKYTPEGGRVTVAVVAGRTAPADVALPLPSSPGATRCAGDYVYVTVADTGIGIEEVDLRSQATDGERPSVFDAFRRGNIALAAQIPGTGLGLSIVREVVEQAGGFIHVRSAPGEGSTFVVAFRAAAAEPVAAVPDTRTSLLVELGKPRAMNSNR